MAKRLLFLNSTSLVHLLAIDEGAIKREIRMEMIIQSHFNPQVTTFLRRDFILAVSGATEIRNKEKKYRRNVMVVNKKSEKCEYCYALCVINVV